MIVKLMEVLAAIWLLSAAVAGAAGNAKGAGAARGGAEQRWDIPEGLMFGAATAAYQIEGGWNASDKTPSIWDTYSHAGSAKDGDTGDVACDSYRLWQRDIDMVEELGLDFYRFSISWTRVLPSGYPDRVSAEGAAYYSRLIDELLRRGIQPLVTMYHWDLPQNLQDLGGWANPLVVEWFADYARVLFDLYADRVRLWLTVNEPLAICDLGYGDGMLAPELHQPRRASYLCNKHILLAHAKAYRIYDEEFRHKNPGKISYCNHLFGFEPYSPEDEELTELARLDQYGRYMHPVFSAEGGWPARVEQHIAANSRAEGLPRSRLPPFTQEERDFVKGTFDFIAVNQYTSRQVRPQSAPADPGMLFALPEYGIEYHVPEDWALAASSWFAVYPPGMRGVLRWLRQEYGDHEFMITENGYSSGVRELQDDVRLDYYKQHLEQVLLAVQDGVNITAFTAWSLMDNFEWMDGYSNNFGLYEVDFTSPLLPRTPRRSAHYLAAVARARSLRVAGF